jgi:DNA polymerase/3'-5' exonuclease PolX
MPPWTASASPACSRTWPRCSSWPAPTSSRFARTRTARAPSWSSRATSTRRSRPGALRKVPGIGDTIFGHAAELVRTGRIAYYDELRASYPPGLTDCLRIPRLGARKLRTLHQELGVDSLEALEAAASTAASPR